MGKLLRSSSKGGKKSGGGGGKAKKSIGKQPRKGKGKGDAGGKGKGKGKGGGGKGGGGKGEAKGGGKSASGGKGGGKLATNAAGEKLTRKQRKQVLKGGGKGKARVPGASSSADAASSAKSAKTPVKEKRKKAGKKGAAQDNNLKSVTAKQTASEQQHDPKASFAPEIKCKHGHSMVRRSLNPRGYKNDACCDVCGVDNLPKKRSHFFHCSFCRWDMCPECSQTWTPEQRKRRKADDAEADDDDVEASGRRKRRRGEKSGGSGNSGEQEPKDLGFSRARREIWLPTDETAVNRAPVKTDVVSDWVEGVPL